MDLVNLASSMQQARTAQAIGIAVAGKAMDAQRQQGKGALEMLNAASQVAKAGDAMVAQATGRGGQIDVRG